nr:hypothetical protein [Alkalihalobacterium alkalinitrilicum]
MDKYHCCATCKWFKVIKKNGYKTTYQCSRLGFETHTKYKFDCWKPKNTIYNRINLEKSNVL